MIKDQNDKIRYLNKKEHIAQPHILHSSKLAIQLSADMERYRNISPTMTRTCSPLQNLVEEVGITPE